MIKNIASWFARHPKWTCFLAGCLAAPAMAPTFYWPLMLVAVSAVTLVLGTIEKPLRGAWSIFAFGMGFFIFGLYWIANALLIKIEDYWWVMGFSIFGLPLLLSICWFVAGWLAVRFSKPHTLARSLLFLALLPLAEYGRAFNLTGFPWNKFGYVWGFNLPVMQIASFGGAYFLTALTIFWMAVPALVWQSRQHKTLQRAILGIAVASFAAVYAYGVVRLEQNPTRFRDDFAVAIIQPNISQDEKWESGRELEHFMRHIDIMRNAIPAIDALAPSIVAFVWPETSLEEQVLMGIPDAPKALLGVMGDHDYKTELVSGLWRQDGFNEKRRPNYYNSLAGVVIADDGRLALDTLYDKHHLVPFGEFLPLEETLDLTPVVGFAGFRRGPGPRVQVSSVVPPYAAMICFEAIFPWYAESKGAEWLVNTSNDGWYGDTPGPYQHLVMTRFRAVEQGKPIARAATTGISALIDPYGRIVDQRAYETAGSIVSKMPKTTSGPTGYSLFGELPFFILILVATSGYALLRVRNI